MIRFLDGPAQGIELECRRAPVMLRAVQNRFGNWDALDQPHDVVRSSEAVSVYILATKPVFYPMRATIRELSGMWSKAEYKLWTPQPFEDRVRANNSWQRWALQHRAEIEKRLPAGVTLRAGANHPEGLT